jgi:hypothetical protein
MIPYSHRIGGPDPFDPEFTTDGTGNDLSIVCLHSIPTAGGFYDGPFIQSINFGLKIHISDVFRILKFLAANSGECASRIQPAPNRNCESGKVKSSAWHTSKRPPLMRQPLKIDPGRG